MTRRGPKGLPRELRDESQAAYVEAADVLDNPGASAMAAPAVPVDRNALSNHAGHGSNGRYLCKLTWPCLVRVRKARGAWSPRNNSIKSHAGLIEPGNPIFVD